MREVRIPHIKQVKITLLQKGDRPASVACCGGWAKWSHRRHMLSLNIEVELNATATNRLLEYLSCGERHFTLEIQSRRGVEPTKVKLIPNCRTENIAYESGPPRWVGSDPIRYRFKIRTEQGAIRTHGERVGAGRDIKDVKTLKQRRSGSTPSTNRVRSVLVGR